MEKQDEKKKPEPKPVETVDAGKARAKLEELAYKIANMSKDD